MKFPSKVFKVIKFGCKVGEFRSSVRWIRWFIQVIFPTFPWQRIVLWSHRLQNSMSGAYLSVHGRPPVTTMRRLQRRWSGKIFKNFVFRAERFWWLKWTSERPDIGASKWGITFHPEVTCGRWSQFFSDSSNRFVVCPISVAFDSGEKSYRRPQELCVCVCKQEKFFVVKFYPAGRYTHGLSLSSCLSWLIELEKFQLWIERNLFV